MHQESIFIADGDPFATDDELSSDQVVLVARALEHSEDLNLLAIGQALLDVFGEIGPKIGIDNPLGRRQQDVDTDGSSSGVHRNHLLDGAGAGNLICRGAGLCPVVEIRGWLWRIVLRDCGAGNEPTEAKCGNKQFFLSRF